MIKAIEIKKFGSYTDFDWKKDIGNYETDDKTSQFSEINIIYGRNYSGKTNLSRIINCLDKKIIPNNYQNSEFKIILDDNNEITNNKLENNFNVKVYNSDFIKEKLKWFYDENSNIEPFTILGEKNIEIQNKIDELEKKKLN